MGNERARHCTLHVSYDSTLNADNRAKLVDCNSAYYTSCIAEVSTKLASLLNAGGMSDCLEHVEVAEVTSLKDGEHDDSLVY